MGGAAFAADGLLTPRIPIEIYESVLKEVETRLSPLYKSAVHAIPAPEKQDHGDIDILAAPLAGQQPQPAEIAKILNAKRYYTASSANQVMNFAIPWPASDNQIIVDEAEKSIQVDLTVCDSMQDLHWHLFAFGHGDLLNILASIVRQKGLTLSSQALWLRIPGFDDGKNKRNTRIELSKDPEQVLTFLGLDSAQFWQPFTSREDLMTYIATCRFYNPAREYQHIENKRHGIRNGSPPPKSRHQLEERPLFRYWQDVFVAAHRNDAPRRSADITRSEVEEEAFAFFAGDTRERYETVRREIITTLAREKLWEGINTTIARENPEFTTTDTHDTLRAVRRAITTPGNSATDDLGLSEVQKAYVDGDWAIVHKWAVAHYRTLLLRWREQVARSRGPPNPTAKKTNKFSTSEAETYTEADDRMILQMKSEDASWTDILGILEKKSKSQLQAHWKNNLQKRQTAS